MDLSSDKILTPSESLKRDIDQVYAKAATFGGQQGFFVSKQRLGSLEAAYEALAAQLKQHKSDPAATKLLEDKISDYRDLIDQLHVRNERAEASLQDLEVEVQKQKAAFERMNESFQQANANTKKSKDMYFAVLKEKTEGVKHFNAIISDLNAELKKAKFDPDSSLQSSLALDTAKQELSTLQGELAALRIEHNEQTAAAQKAVAEHLAAQAELNAAFRRLKEGKRLKAESFKQMFTETAGVPTTPASVSNNLKRLLGNKGIEWLQHAEAALHDDYRERAYNLMLATKSSSQKRIKSISNLLEMVYVWLKKKAFNSRKVVQAWLDRIQADLKNGTVQTVQFYRELLQQAVGEANKRAILKEKIDAHYEKREVRDLPAPTGWKSFYYTLVVIKNRVVRRFRKWNQSQVSTPKKGWFSWLGWFKFWGNKHPDPSQDYVNDEVVFQAEDFPPLKMQDCDPSPVVESGGPSSYASALKGKGKEV